MTIENIVLARKLSVLEYDMNRYETNFEQSVLKYYGMGADGEKIIKSHERQLQSEKLVLDALRAHPDLEDMLSIIRGDTIPQTIIGNKTLIVALGGDNYFQHISHYLKDQPLVGVNSDPVNSEGALTYFTPERFIDFLPKLESGEFNVEEWTRLQATINRKVISTLATSEIYYGAHKSTDMSRYLLFGLEEQKSSGLIITTGAGSTGWYKAASAYIRGLTEKPKIYPKTYPNALVVAREIFAHEPHTLSFEFSDKLELKWLAHGNGLVSIDARDEYEIVRGDEVVIKVSDTPLKVVTP